MKREAYKDDHRPDTFEEWVTGLNTNSKCYWPLGLGIGCNFMIGNQLQPTDRLSIIINSSHFCSNSVLGV